MGPFNLLSTKIAKFVVCIVVRCNCMYEAYFGATRKV